MVKVFGRCTDGNSLNVSTNLATATFAARMKKLLFRIQSQYVSM
jgi:hypothetical protein